MGDDFMTWLYLAILAMQLVLVGLMSWNAWQQRKIRREQADIDAKLAALNRELDEARGAAEAGPPPGMRVSGGVRISQGPDGRHRVEVMDDSDMPPEVRAGLREALTHWLESMKRRDN